MGKTLYSAAEILKMGISGLPTSRSSLLSRAQSEGWYSEERTGIGGTHKVYEIPARYLGSEAAGASGDATQPSKTPQIASIAFAKTKEKRERMLLIMEALETFLAENNLKMAPERKVFLVDVLDRYFELEGVFSKEKLVETIKKLA